MPTPAEDLNSALRDLIEVVRTADLADGDLGPEIQTVRGLADGLRPRRHDGMRMQAALRHGDQMDNGAITVDENNPGGIDDLAQFGDAAPGDFFPYSPIVGRLNPISLPVRMWRVAGENGTEICGDAVFGAAYNGPPDCVHGGVIAATFDELLGCVCVTNGLGGFTGTLTVVYRNTTPLEQPLTLRGWHDRTEGRKVLARGELRHGDTLCAEAEGIFIRSPTLPGGGVARAVG